MIQTIATDKAPSAIGPYSQGKVFGDLIFTSGQIALDSEGRDYTDTTVEEQTRLAMSNLKEVLQAAGGNFETVIKTTIFLIDMSDFQAVNGVYGSFFGSEPPARSTVAVKQLPKGARVEIECIAHRTR